MTCKADTKEEFNEDANNVSIESEILTDKTWNYNERMITAK